MDGKIIELKTLIDAADGIVFFGGAGVSTESGIPDFRSAGGLYNRRFKYPPEYMLSHTFFVGRTGEFFDFYRAEMLPPQTVGPNAAHIFLADIERAGKRVTVITQNIDGLHQAAGSKNVLELHGSVWRNYCMDCGKFYETDIKGKGVPCCPCGGIIKPDVVLYEEQLDDGTLAKSAKAISESELMIIGGTSLSVYPAAGLVQYFGGKNLVIINKTPTQYDRKAGLLIGEGIGKVFKAVSEMK